MGSDEKGNPIEQHFTQEALSQIADELNSTETEVLMDKDHASARKGLERDTQSLGWFSKFVASAKGLFGLLKLTKKGREMIEGREYRHVSPVFALNEDKEPIRLLSVAATNTPALRVPENVILNAEPEQSNSEVLHMDITKEELVELIKSTFTAMNAKTTTCDNDSTCEDGKVAVNQGNEPNEPSKPTTPCEPAGQDEKSQNDEPSASDEPSTPEEPTTDEPKTDDLSPKTVSDKAETTKEDEPEVIKEEVLNTAPTTSIPKVEEEWRNLKGEEFRKWCAEHAHYCNTYRGE